ncbi:50S ribosomal protein L11 methyltransferase [Candidatus Sumerlaeota bacterium]|nr:50S ribosomal protein L11 methyltransferase [Candidatus Sumerlaeota bacterium]
MSAAPPSGDSDSPSRDEAGTWLAFRVLASADVLSDVEDEILALAGETDILGTSREIWLDPASAAAVEGGESRAESRAGECLHVYLAREADPQRVAADLDEILEARFGSNVRKTGRIRIEPISIPEEDWATRWRDFFRPIRVSPRLLILPAWWKDADTPEPIVLRINPGRAFGSGTHATTRLSLRFLERLVRPGRSVLDFGAGSGILAFAARALGAGRVVAIEVDEDCLENYTENARINGVETEIDYRIGSSERLALGEVFDLVVCNALFDRVSPHFEALVEHLVPDGTFLYSGFLVSESETVTERLESLGLTVEQRENMEEWQAAVARGGVEDNLGLRTEE